MNKPTTIKELCEFIWYLEDKYDLLDFTIDGVKVWQYKRMEIYYILSEKTGILQQAHSKVQIMNKFFGLFNYLKYSIYNIFKSLKEVDSVVFSHSRVFKINGEYIDIYTKYLIDELKESESIIELEQPYLSKHLKNRHDNVYYTDGIDLYSKIAQYFYVSNFTPTQKKLINNLEYEITNYLDVSIDLSKYLISSAKKFRSKYYLYFRFLKKTNPKKVYIVISYAKAEFIKAAKDLSIEVIELQHGTLSKYHLGYSFPNLTKKLDYFPDKFYVWNDFWKNHIKYPIIYNNIIVDKFRYLINEKAKYSHLEKIHNQVLIISQGVIGEKIAEIILNNIDYFTDKVLKYKLHPGEYDRWKNYPSLVKLSKFKNIDIIEDADLYSLFSTSTLLIGVFSTAIYESLEFDCDIVLLDLPGIEYMNDFISTYNCKVVKEFNL